MRIVAALGGNALQRRDEPAEIEVMRRNARAAAQALAPLARDHELVVTHGNGPQVGLLALQAAADHAHAMPPFDVLGAETEGLIGYILAQELINAFHDKEVAMLLTQTVVDVGDPAFDQPSKPIGPVYGLGEGRRLGAARGWGMVADGDGLRRAIASPRPCRIVELAAIEALLGQSIVPICAGGGGVPVVEGPNGLTGVEAVVDKDRTSALLAEQIGAGLLLLLTDVDAVRLGWGTPAERPLLHATPATVADLDLPAGSIGPKVEAAAAFVAATGKRAAIGSLIEAMPLVEASAGTQFSP